MKKDIIETARPSSGTYEVLEEMVRLKVTGIHSGNPGGGS